MSVDPPADYFSHDPEDGEGLSDDPRIREQQEYEARMRRALATKEDPLRDDESTSERLRRLAREDKDRSERDRSDGSEPARSGSGGRTSNCSSYVPSRGGVAASPAP